MIQCDLPAEDVEWCMRVLNVVLQRSLWAQDVIASLVRGRLRGGDCSLPDGGARGCACQTTHALLVGVARAYLDSLHGASAASWLDPEMLPPEHESGEEEAEVPPAEGERSRSPRPQGGVLLRRLPAREATDAVDAEAPRGESAPSGAASSHEWPGRPATAAPAPPVEQEALEGGYGSEDLDEVREVVVAPVPEDSAAVDTTEDVSLVQMLFMNEGEILLEAGVNRAARLRLNDFLAACARAEDVPVEWAFLLLLTTVDAQVRALQAVSTCLRARGVAAQALPSENARAAASRMSACAIRGMARVVSDIGEAQLVNAVVQPFSLPLELHGGPARSRSPPRSGRLRRGGPQGDHAGPSGEDAPRGVVAPGGDAAPGGSPARAVEGASGAAGGPPAREGGSGRGRGRHGTVRSPAVLAAGRHRPRRNETSAPTV